MFLYFDIPRDATEPLPPRASAGPGQQHSVNMMTLRWNEIAGPEDGLHLVRVAWGRNLFPRVHRHDFPEIFWLDSGSCLHRINGHEQPLKRGDLVFIRPNDTHQIIAGRTGGFTFTNFAFPTDILRGLRERFPAEMQKVYPADCGQPVTRSLGRLYARVDAEVRELSELPHSRFFAERFLLNLLALLDPLRADAEPGGMPDWLQTACLELRQPEVFSEGVAGFVRVAGRSPEHVARSVRLHLKKTPGDLVTAARMEYATKELRFTSKSVLEVGFDCGYAKPSRFFEVFRRHFGTSPLRYRRQQQQVV